MNGDLPGPTEIVNTQKECCEMSSTVQEKLAMRKRSLEAQLADVNNAIKALEDNPGVSNVLTLLGKVRLHGLF